MKLWSWTALAAAALLAAGCGKPAEGPVLARGKAIGARGPAEPAVPVAAQAAVTGPIASHYTTTAVLEVEKEAEILARVRGIVQSLAVEEGDRVKKGGELLEIDNSEYSLLLKKAESNTRNAKAKYERMEQLSGDLISTEEFETARRDLAAAQSEEGLARLDLSYTTVTAPFTGRVTRRHVDVGQNVSIGTPLFTLADFEPLLARVHVPAKEFRKIQTDQAVELVLDSTGERLKGRITLISPTIDSKSGTIKITVEIPEYPQHTRPGDFAEVLIVTEQHEASTLVPRIAVITDKGEQVVYVDMAKGGPDQGGVRHVAERRVVEVGFTTDDHAEILEGVEPGERVIVKGQRSLKNGTPLKILGEESAGPPAAPGRAG